MGTEAPRPAFYALRAGGWRDYVTVLHLPYTAWNLAYVALGAALAPHFHTDRMLWTMAAFALGLGVSAHVLDELNGRPLAHRDPRARAGRRSALASLAGACAIGVWAAVELGLRPARLRRRRRASSSPPTTSSGSAGRFHGALVARARLGRAPGAERLLRPGRQPARRRRSSPPATRRR